MEVRLLSSWPKNKIILRSLSRLNAITRVLKKIEEEGRRIRCFAAGFKMEEGATSQGMQAASKSWRKTRK